MVHILPRGSVYLIVVLDQPPSTCCFLMLTHLPHQAIRVDRGRNYLNFIWVWQMQGPDLRHKVGPVPRGHCSMHVWQCQVSVLKLHFTNLIGMMKECFRWRISFICSPLQLSNSHTTVCLLGCMPLILASPAGCPCFTGGVWQTPAPDLGHKAGPVPRGHCFMHVWQCPVSVLQLHGKNLTNGNFFCFCPASVV